MGAGVSVGTSRKRVGVAGGGEGGGGGVLYKSMVFLYAGVISINLSSQHCLMPPQNYHNDHLGPHAQNATDIGLKKRG